MWTEAHRARHEAGLDSVMTMFAVVRVPAWLVQADPPRSARALSTLAVIGLIAWHLRVFAPWRAPPAGYPYRCTVWRLAPALGREGAVLRP